MVDVDIPRRRASRRRYFRSLETPEAFIEEFIDGASRDNYGQSGGTMNAFADLVSLAGASLEGDVFELEEGTAQIPRSLLASAGAEVRLNATVEAVRKANRGCQSCTAGYTVETADGTSTAVDALVVATPLEFTSIELPVSVEAKRPYESTYVALASGTLSHDAFGSAATTLDAVLTVETPNVSYSCIGAHGTLASGDTIWKIMSRTRLSDAILDEHARAGVGGGSRRRRGGRPSESEAGRGDAAGGRRGSSESHRSSRHESQNS